MLPDHESEIETCLAYEVLRDPDNWIGGPSTLWLDAFLHGASFRRDFAGPSIPDSLISGVLNEPAFFQQFIDATGHPTLTIKWATAIAMTDLSLAAGFAKLKAAAIDWHGKYGVTATKVSNSLPHHVRDNFWQSFAERPAMYMGDSNGWTLYCFLNGMKRGGDWLHLNEMPRLDEVFGGIQQQSERAYGSPFAAFRVCDSRRLLEWVGLPDRTSTC